MSFKVFNLCQFLYWFWCKCASHFCREPAIEKTKTCISNSYLIRQSNQRYKRYSINRESLEVTFTVPLSWELSMHETKKFGSTWDLEKSLSFIGSPRSIKAGWSWQYACLKSYSLCTRMQQILRIVKRIIYILKISHYKILKISILLLIRKD